MTSRFDTSVWIHGPPDETFAAYVDPRRFASWVAGFVRLEPIEGPLGAPGSRCRVAFADSGREVWLDERILEVDPPRAFAYEMTGPHTSTRTRVTLRAEGRGTRMDWDEEMRGRSLLGRVLLPLLARRQRRRVDRNLARLKAAIEAAKSVASA